MGTISMHRAVLWVEDAPAMPLRRMNSPVMCRSKRDLGNTGLIILHLGQTASSLRQLFDGVMMQAIRFEGV